MNTHRSFGFLAAVLVTVAQILVVSAGTTAAASDRGERTAYEASLHG